jgi:hypothetical protein
MANHEPRTTNHYNGPMKRLALALALLVASTLSAELPFIEDDYQTALARAKSKNVPLFVEAWAPW